MSNGGDDIDPDDVDDVDDPGLSTINRLWRIRQIQRRVVSRLRHHDHQIERLERALAELVVRLDRHFPPHAPGGNPSWLNETMIKVIVSGVVTLIVSLALGRLFIFPPS